MFMNLKELEHIIRDKYSTEGASPDMDKMWKVVEPQIQKKRMRRIAWLWLGLGFGFGLGLILVGLAGYSLIEWDAKVTESTGVVATVEETLTSSANESHDIESLGKATQREVAEGFTTSEEVSMNLSADELTVGKEISQEVSRHTGVTNRFDNVSTTYQRSIHTTGHIAEIPSVSLKEANKDEVVEDLKSRTSAVIEMIPLTMEKLQSSTSRSVELNTSTFLVEVVKEHRIVQGLGVLLGYGISSMTLSSVDESHEEEFIFRSRNEEAIEALSAGINYSYEIGAKIRLETGLNYTRLTDRVTNYFHHDDVVVNHEAVIIEVEGPDGIEFITGEAKELQTTYMTVTHYNYHHDIGLPLEVFYKIGGERQYFEIGGGMEMGLRSIHRGYIQESPNDHYDLKDDDAGRYDRNFRKTLLGSIGYGRSLSNRWDFVSRLGIRWDIDSASSNSYPIRQKYYSLILKTGLKFRF